jgi:hypothetical protein
VGGESVVSGVSGGLLMIWAVIAWKPFNMNHRLMSTLFGCQYKYWAAKRTEPRWKDLVRMALEYLTTLYQLCLLFLLFALRLLADDLLLVFGLALQSR